MDTRKQIPRVTLWLILLLFMLTTINCKNNLLQTIDEEVAVAVTPPAMSNRYPTEDATEIEVGINAISVDFTKSIDSSSITPATLSIRDEGGQTVSGQFTVSGQTVSFSPSGNLQYGHTYSVTVTAGIKDTDGNPLSSEITWSFTTAYDPGADRTPPEIVDFLLNGGVGATSTTAVTADIVADDNGGRESLSYMLRLEGAEWPEEWTAMNSEGMASASLVLTVELGNQQIVETRIRDEAGNISDIYQAGIFYEQTEPQVLSVTPDGLDVPGDTSVAVITFNEEMKPLTIATDTIYIEDSAGSSTTVMADSSLAFIDNNDIPKSQIQLTGIRLDQFETYEIVITAAVEDAAGNPLGEEKRYSFATTSASDDTPPTVTLSIDSLSGHNPALHSFLTLDNGIQATNWEEVILSVDAADDFNGVKDMKIWDGTSSEPAGYQDFSAQYPLDIDPALNGSGIKYIYYKVRDWANNMQEGYIQIILDKEPPQINSFQIDGGATHSTDKERKATLNVDGTDQLPSGVKLTGITHMVLSNDDTDFDDDNDGNDDWITWESSIEEYLLSETNGNKAVYIKLKDSFDQESTISSASIIWDTEEPSVTINESAYLETNTPTQQAAAISDNTDGAPEIVWEQVAGPGTLAISDPAVAQPTLSADTDGDYELTVTVTDAAGNAAVVSIPFIWDTTDPDDSLSVASSQYNNSGLPEWTWPSVNGADFYRVTFNAAPAWDDPAFSDYIETTQTSYSPSAALADGNHTLRVTAWDNAGNRANTEQSSTTTVDTIPPVITGDGQLFLTNGTITLDFTSATTGDGEVQESGSGLNSGATLWEQLGSGTGTVSFSDNTGLTTQVSTDVAAGNREVFDLQLTVEDLAENSTTAQFTLDWDREPPNPPDMDAVGWDETEQKYHTPDLTPTWFWESSNGSGNYEYKFDDAASWTATTDTSFTPSSLTPGNNESSYTYYLYLRERDAAGNWSAETNLGVWVDDTHISAPSLMVDVPARTTNTSITWSWSSGATPGDTGTILYRYTTDNWSSYENSSGASGDYGESFTLDASGQAAGTTVTYTFRIEEYYNSEWQGVTQNLYGVNTVTVDLEGPSPPSVTVDARTRDTTPSWTWSSTAGDDGTGDYSYQLNSTSGSWSAATTQTAYTPTAALDEGSNILYVRERDALGNWSDPVGAEVVIDTTPPTLNGITIHTDTNAGTSENYTNSTNVNIYIDAETAGETGLQIQAYDHVNGNWMSPESYPGSNWTTSVLPTGEGTKYAHLRLIDDVGNMSGYQYDVITMDTTPPSNPTVALNNGEFYTPTYYAYFNADADDNYSAASEIEVQHAYRYYNEANARWEYKYASSWEPIGNGLYFDYKLENTTSSRYHYIYVRFRDAAGNVTGPAFTSNTQLPSGWTGDSVYMQVPAVRYAHKGYSSNGAVNVYYNEVTQPGTSASNRYYIYSTTDPNADPNESTSGFTYEGYADQSASAYRTVYVPTGELRYFWVRGYNADLRGYGYFSEAGALGFSSHVTVVYNDDSSTDQDIAEFIKDLLEDAYYSGGIESQPNMAGTMPNWSVTLLPEDLVENTSTSYYHRIYGDPLIITPATTFLWDSSTYDNRIYNLSSSGRGILAMGYNGTEFIERVKVNWSSWSYGGTKPVQIGVKDETGSLTQTYGLGSKTSAKKQPASESESIWHSPMENSYLSANYEESSVTLNLFPSDIYRYGVYFRDPLGDDCYIYAGDPDYSSYYPVVRQGRFLQYGFNDVPHRYTTPPSTTYKYGHIFFINLVARMDNF